MQRVRQVLELRQEMRLGVPRDGYITLYSLWSEERPANCEGERRHAITASDFCKHDRLRVPVCRWRSYKSEFASFFIGRVSKNGSVALRRLKGRRTSQREPLIPAFVPKLWRFFRAAPNPQISAGLNAVSGSALPSLSRREGCKKSRPQAPRPHAPWRALKPGTRQQIRNSSLELKRAVALFASAIMLGTVVLLVVVVLQQREAAVFDRAWDDTYDLFRRL